MALSEITVPAGHKRLFTGSFTPVLVGVHYISINASVAGWGDIVQLDVYGIEGAIRTQHTSRSLS